MRPYTVPQVVLLVLILPNTWGDTSTSSSFQISTSAFDDFQQSSQDLQKVLEGLKEPLSVSESSSTNDAKIQEMLKGLSGGSFTSTDLKASLQSHNG